MKTLLRGLGLAVLTFPCFAADLPAQQTTPVANPCTATTCTGFYGGFNVAGSGSGLDVLGSGVFAGGGGIGGQAGYQFWNGTVYFAGEVSGDYMFQNFQTGVAPGAAPGYLFGEFVDLGMPLGSIFGASVSIPSNTLASTLWASTLTPYIKLGAMERPWGTAWATGLGVAFDISTRWFAKLDYIHAVYNNAAVNLSTSQQTDNIIKFGLNYKF